MAGLLQKVLCNFDCGIPFPRPWYGDDLIVVNPFSRAKLQYSWLSNCGPLSGMNSSGIPCRANFLFMALMTVGCYVSEGFQFKEVAVVVDHHEVIAAIQLEKICTYFRPRSSGYHVISLVLAVARLGRGHKVHMINMSL